MSVRPLYLFECVASARLLGQDATVTGIVTDSANALVPGVSMKIRNTETKRRLYLAGDYPKVLAVVNLRPFPFFNGAINQFGFHSNSIYNAGRISLRKRGNGGASQLNGNSDSGLLAASRDINNRRADRGRSHRDRGHVVTASFSWQLPFGRGRRFLPGLKGLGQGAIGGWQFSGTTFFATGAPLTTVAADTNLNLGESQKPNRIGKGVPDEIPGLRPGADYPWFVPSDFVHTTCVSVKVGCPAEFKPFVYGNSGRNILDGPRRAYINAAMMKNFRFQERKEPSVAHRDV